MMKGGHGPTKLLHALTWGAFNHASHAPQVRACNHYVLSIVGVSHVLLSSSQRLRNTNLRHKMLIALGQP